MRKELKNTIIVGVAALLSAAACMGLGFLTAHLTGASKPDTGKKDPVQNEDPLNPSDENPDTPGSEPENEEPPVSSVHLLNDTELKEIAGTYSDEVKSYYASDLKDEKGRPLSCVSVSDTLTGLFGDSVKVFGPDDKNFSLRFLLNTEYGSNTSYILEQLKLKEVTATFFIDMTYAVNNPGVVERIIKDGHTLGSMGTTVPATGLASLPIDEQMTNIYELQNYIFVNYGYDMKDFYLVYDCYSEQTVALLTRMGYRVRFSDVLYKDYDTDEPIDSNAFLTSMENAAHNGVTYTFHTTNSASLLVVPALISTLKSAGYTVSN